MTDEAVAAAGSPGATTALAANGTPTDLSMCSLAFMPAMIT